MKCNAEDGNEVVAWWVPHPEVNVVMGICEVCLQNPIVLNNGIWYIRKEYAHAL